MININNHNNYTKEKLYSDISGGIFNGLIFSMCWGFVNGTYYSYKPPIKPALYLTNIRKYMGKSLISLTPVFTIARITNNYCKDNGYSSVYASAITFGICFGFLMVFKISI